MSKNNLPNLFMICLSLAIVMISISFDKSHEISKYRLILSNLSKSIPRQDSIKKVFNDSIIKENKNLIDLNKSMSDSISTLNKKVLNIKYLLSISKKDSL